MARVSIVSFRLGGTDGVSVEADKWAWALRELGHSVRTVAGAGRADWIDPGLAIGATTAPDVGGLRRELSDSDLVVVENVASLPLNVAARDALYGLLHGRAALFRHHDLAWQRPDSVDDAPPRDEPAWRHVVINERSRRELAERGVVAHLERNRFDCDPPLGARDALRAELGVDGVLALFPSRAIPRKNVGGALRLAERLGATVWLLGPPEDGYDATLAELLAGRGDVLRRGLDPWTIHDAYAACDLVVVPSTWEGFGNPVLESVTHRRPLAVHPYPVLSELRALGFDFADLEDVATISERLSGAPRVLERNLALARRHLDLADLPGRLAAHLRALSVE